MGLGMLTGSLEVGWSGWGSHRWSWLARPLGGAGKSLLGRGISHLDAPFGGGSAGVRGYSCASCMDSAANCDSSPGITGAGADAARSTLNRPMFVSSRISVKPSLRKHLRQVFLAAAAPLAFSVAAPEAQAIPPNAGDPLAYGGSPTFDNVDAGWSYSLFGEATSTYPFTPFTDPACTPGPSGTCADPNYVFDQSKVVWAGNASVTSGSGIVPVTTIDTGATFPNVNDPYTPAYAPKGAPSDGGWVFGYVFGPADGVSYNGASVNYLGFFNGNGADIRESHKVSLWEYFTGDPTVTPPTELASTTIAPGPVLTVCDVYSDLFCWVAVGPISLDDAKFYTVGAYGGFSPGTPAPMPLLGAAAAFGLSRKVRQRIRFGSLAS